MKQNKTKTKKKPAGKKKKPGPISLRALGAGITLAVLSSCAKSPEKAAEAVKQTIQEPALMKTWQGECKSTGEMLKLSTQVFFQFAGNTVKEIHTFYENANCAEPASVDVTYSGDFVFQDKAENSHTRPIDLKFNEGYVVPRTPKGKEVLEAVQFCGIQQWPVSESKQVTGNSGTVGCPVRKLPSAQYNIFSIEGDTLVFGDYGFFDNDTVAKDRPTELDTSVSYRPSKRDVSTP